MTFAEVKLADVADQVTVGHVGSMAGDYVSSGIPFLRSLNVEPYRISTGDLKFITAEFHGRLKKSALRPGDVVIVRTGKPGICAVVPDWLENANCSDLVIVRCGPRIDPRYLSYWVNSLASHHIGSNLVGAVQQHFNVGAAKEMPILLPSMEAQTLTLSALASLDEKIELNRRMSETLDGMAQAIFRDWFVDFGPVRRKISGATDPVETMAGLIPDANRAASLSALFPDEWSAEGLPKGWTTSTLGEESSVLLGGTPSRARPDYWGGDVPWINSGKANEFRVIEPSEYITQRGLQSSATKLLPRRTTLIAITGATLGQVSLSEIETCANQSIVGVVGSLLLPPEYIYLWVKEYISILVSRQTGGAQQHINKGNVDELHVIRPDTHVLEAWSNIATPIFDRIAAAGFESQSLRKTRDYLLPHLLSGSARVGAVEHAGLIS